MNSILNFTHSHFGVLKVRREKKILQKSFNNNSNNYNNINLTKNLLYNFNYQCRFFISLVIEILEIIFFFCFPYFSLLLSKRILVIYKFQVKMFKIRIAPQFTTWLKFMK